ncbi:DUF72 domain-containing protein [candidate division KSB1 bacterium]|nr:DUF72 domain-containing protein [candidate division KSB1 bacterium]
MEKSIKIGCSGWAIPKQFTQLFPEEGTYLERYATKFDVVEISSTFYRPHKPAVYENWANSVPEHFRFIAKMPKQLTHVRRLKEIKLLEAFLEESAVLGEKRGGLLAQIPPSFQFDEVVENFFAELRERYDGTCVFEPRHQSWFEPEANEAFLKYRIVRAASNPAVVPEAVEPGGLKEFAYFRLHGSPHKYYSSYTPEFLTGLAKQVNELDAEVKTVWVIFDNTALGNATGNAMDLVKKMAQ